MNTDTLKITFGELNQLSEVIGKLNAKRLNTQNDVTIFTKMIALKVRLSAKTKEYIENLKQTAEEYGFTLNEDLSVNFGKNIPQETMLQFQNAVSNIAKVEHDFSVDSFRFLTMEKIEAIVNANEQLTIEDCLPLYTWLVSDQIH